MKLRNIALLGLMILIGTGCGVSGGPSLKRSSSENNGSRNGDGAQSGSPIVFSGTLSPSVANQYQSNDFFQSVGVDTSGNFYFYFHGDGNYNTGSGPAADGLQDGVLIKYSPAGVKQWVRLVSAVTGSYVVAGAVKVSQDGGVYVAGRTDANVDTNVGPSPGNNTAYVIKYDTSGNRIWAKQYNAGFSQISAIDTDAAGNVYVVGTSNGNISGSGQIGNNDVFIMKFDTLGNRAWVVQKGVSSTSVGGSGIAVNQAGTAIYVAGSGSGNLEAGTASIGVSDSFLLKYDASGTLVWAKSRGVASRSFNIQGIVLNENTSTIYVAANTTGSWNNAGAATGAYDATLTRYTDTGVTATFVNSVQYGVATKFSTSGAPRLGSDGSVYLGGFTEGYIGTDGGGSMVGSQDAFVGKFDAALNVQWIKHFGVPSESTTMQGIAVNSDGNVVISGTSTGNTVTGTGSSVGSPDVFLKMFSSAGVPF